MQPSPASDRELIEAGCRGDRAAFAQIVERYQRTVYAVSYATTRDRALADDLTQDTFVMAWHRITDLRNSTRLPAWLCGIARNLARRAMKRQRREPARDVPEVVDPTTPFDALSEAESERLIVAALDAVPAAYREPLVLFYFEQRSVEGVARALGLTAHTTNKRLSRGRQHLAARVEELVERKLAVRAPRGDLVASVVAAIAVLGSGSHVDASPLTAKGSIMPKLALATLLVATASGVGLLSASVDRAPMPKPQRSATNTASPAAAVKPVTATLPAPATPAPIAATAKPTASSGTPRHRSQARPQLPPAPSSVADCATVARHLAKLTFEAFSSAKHMPAQKRDQFMALRTRDLTAKCAAERWSDDRRVCAMSATDNDDAFACRENTIGTSEELDNLPVELQCAAVAEHLAKLATGPGGKFEIVATKMAERGLPFDMQQMKIQLRDQTRAKCEDIPWSLSMRRCIAASKTQYDAATCW